MKKTLIALAVLGATAGVAHAQSNVTIYGIVDTGYIKQTGSAVYMNEKVNNRLGFRGVEDLGGGLKATFELEERFNLADGKDKGVRFDGASNVGLAGSWGAVRFGRMNEVPTEYFRTLDPFNQYGVGGMFENPYRSARISSTARYDSPNFSGFNFAATYSLKNQDANYNDGDMGPNENNGWAVGGRYANGPISVLASYNRPVNSDKAKGWNVGGAYAFGPAKISLGYEKVSLEGLAQEDRNFGEGSDVDADGDWKNILVGASYKIGNGVINASFNRAKVDSGGAEYTDKKYAIGYTHNLSKRTSVYADYSRTKWDNDRDIAGSAWNDDTINSYQIGVTHKF